MTTQAPTTLVDILQRRCARQPSDRAFTFLLDDDQQLVVTYAGLQAAASRVAETLVRLAAPGSRALLLFDATPDFLYAFFGCLLARVVAVPTYSLEVLASPHLLGQLMGIAADAQPSCILTTSALAPVLQSQLGGTALEKLPIIPVDKLESLGGDAAPRRSSPTDLAMLQYTSGSTSTPKGVAVTHAHLLANEAMMTAAFGQDARSDVASWLPMFHDMGLIGNVLQPFCLGSHAVLMSPMRFLSRPVRWLQAISNFRTRTSGAPNFAYDLCVRRITVEECEGLDLSCWKLAYNGAEPVRAATMERFTRAFAPFGFRKEAFFPCYGLAEASLFVAGGPRFDEAGRENRSLVRVAKGPNSGADFVSCGKPAQGSIVAVVDPDTRISRADGQVGEVWVAGPHVAAGYWGREAESARAFGAVLANGSGGPFLRTGDLGFLRDGELFVTGRIKDLLIIHGQNHYAQDLELVVEKAHAAVRRGCSVAFAYDRDGEEVVGVIAEVRESGVARLDEIVRAVRLAIATAQAIAVKRIALVAARCIPKTSSGKVQRSLCRKLLESGELSTLIDWRAPETTPQPASPPANAQDAGPAWTELLQRGAASALRVAPELIEPQMDLLDLGIDSLGAAELATLVESWGGPVVSRDLIFQIRSIDGLVEHILRIHPERPHNRAAAESQATEEPVVVEEAARSHPTAKAPNSRSVLLHRVAGTRARLETWRSEDQYFYHREIERQDARSIVTGGRELVMLGSYSYLGLMGHPRLHEAALDATDRFCTGVHGARVLAGTTVVHCELERELARLTRSSDAIVYPTGYVTNLSTICAIVGKGDTVIGDELNHASIAAGCRASGARFLTFRHNDLSDLERCLATVRQGITLVVVDGIYSMEGDIADLPRIVHACKAAGALLMVDEAHSMGVLGADGRGVQEHFQLPVDAIDLKMGTLSKAFSSIGGYIAGDAPLIDHLRHSAGGYVFSGTIPTPQAATALEAIRLLSEEPWRVGRLWEVRERFATGLQRLGFDLFTSNTPIVPIRCPDEKSTLQATRRLLEEGFFVVPVFYPAVPMNAPRLRTCVMASHTDDDIDRALAAFASVGRELGLLDATRDS